MPARLSDVSVDSDVRVVNSTESSAQKNTRIIPGIVHNLICTILKSADSISDNKRKSNKNGDKDVGGCRPAYGKSFLKMIKLKKGSYRFIHIG